MIEARSSRVSCGTRVGSPAAEEREIRRSKKHPKACCWDDAKYVSYCHACGELSAYDHHETYCHGYAEANPWFLFALIKSSIIYETISILC